MAQKQFFNYKDPIESLPISEANLAIGRPGRYTGFDVADFVGNTVTLSHSGKIKKADQLGNLHIFGSFKTPMGLTVHEDASIVLTIPVGNSGFGLKSYTVVAEHDYQEVLGGTAATYTVIGSTGLGYPAPTDPTKQCVIGYITGTVTVTGTIYKYEPAPAPLPGDADIASYLSSIPYATKLVPGIVTRANIISVAHIDPYTDDEKYVTPKQLKASGVTHLINLGEIDSAKGSPGEWVTQEITGKFGDQVWLIPKIQSFDVIIETEIAGDKIDRQSLKVGYFKTGMGLSASTIEDFPVPNIAYPTIITQNSPTPKCWLKFWSNNASDVEAILQVTFTD